MLLRNVAGVFQDLTFESGLGHLQKGHGISFGDLDNDGDIDLFQQLGGAFPYDTYGNALYLNPGSDTRFLMLRLRGTKSNSFGVGSRIEVRYREKGKERSVHRLVGTGGSFGGSSLRQEIGLGNAESILEVLVRWPGRTTAAVVTGIELDGYFEVVEGTTQAKRLELRRLRFDLRGSGRSAEHTEHTVHQQ